MIYLAGLLIELGSRAALPAMGVLLAGSAGLVVIWWIFLRRNQRALAVSWLVLLVGTLGFGGWRSWQVLMDFNHPEIRMFRDYIASPIPAEVVALGLTQASPQMFRDGVGIRFQAPRTLVDQILNHSIPGSKTPGVIAQMKSQSRLDPTDREVLAAADGMSYLKVTPNDFAGDEKDFHKWLRRSITEAAGVSPGAGPARETYLLFRDGAWGRFQSILAYDPATHTVTIEQYLIRQRLPRPPAKGAAPSP